MSPERSVFGTLVDAWRITEKDLLVELRTKEIVLTMGYFGFLVVLIFSFAFFQDGATISSVASGILWVSIAFAGTLGLGRIFEREREGDCIRALLLSPIPRPSIYLGKALGVLIFMLVVEAVVVPSVYFFFNLDLDRTRAGVLLLTVLLGTLGYAIVGTLLAAMLLRARTKDVLLAVVLYPLILPVLIIGVKATGILVQPEPVWNELSLWLRLLGLYDAVFLVASLWIFEPLLLD
ncbi:MAG: heme exporter protein CcmB [Deltaproteobacteria bacterium]|nr:heme exporter protein CcmB [Deltaproteobacteria bacterium]